MMVEPGAEAVKEGDGAEPGAGRTRRGGGLGDACGMVSSSSDRRSIDMTGLLCRWSRAPIGERDRPEGARRGGQKNRRSGFVPRSPAKGTNTEHRRRPADLRSLLRFRVSHYC